MLKILAGMYLLIMMAVGWRLFDMRWTRNRKLVGAVATILPMPLVILLPTLLYPDRPFADLIRAIGVALIFCGAASLSGGMAGAWLRARKR